MFAQVIAQSSVAANAAFDQVAKGIKTVAAAQRDALAKVAATTPGDKTVGRKLVARAEEATKVWEEGFLGFLEAGRASFQATAGLFA